MVLLAFYLFSIAARFALHPDDWLLPVVVLVSLLAFTWLIFVFYWVRGQLRSRAVRRLLPHAVLFELVMTPELADAVLLAELDTGVAAPRVFPQTYLTGAATPEALWLFGGSFRAVQRGKVPADHIVSAVMKTVEFPTRTVTRHFPELIVGVGTASPQLAILPIRTTLMVVRKLTNTQLEALVRDVSSTWHVSTD